MITLKEVEGLVDAYRSAIARGMCADQLELIEGWYPGEKEARTALIAAITPFLTRSAAAVLENFEETVYNHVLQLERNSQREGARAVAKAVVQSLISTPPVADRPDNCARCGFLRKEHSYNGACYGLCGEFVVPEGHRRSAD